MRQTIISLLLVLLVIGSVSGQGSMTDQEQKELLKLFYRDFASRIHFALKKDEPLKLLEKPVMSWVGQETPGQFTSGDVFVWERNGRAEVIGCVGSLPGGGDRRSVFQEFHSLAETPIEQTVLEVEGPWGPKEPGVDMQRVDTKIKPSPSAPLRLAQMRRVAGLFHAYMEPPRQSKEERLRMMSQPVYRFDTKKLKASNSKVVDGGIFAFVWTVGTDPELLLLVECHREDGELVWKYAPVRFTYRVVRLEHNDAEVWKAAVDAGNRTSAYRTCSGGFHSYSAIKNAVAKLQAD